jgi:hypothetical protein
MRRSADAAPLCLTPPCTADNPAKNRKYGGVLHEQADASFGSRVKEQHAGIRRDICPPPWRRTSSRVGGKLNKASNRLRGRHGGDPLLIALDGVAADSGLLRVVELHGVKSATAVTSRQ